MATTPQQTLIRLKDGALIKADHSLQHILGLFQVGPITPTFITITNAETGLNVAIRASLITDIREIY